MIKTLVAHTTEVDEASIAIEEIKSQLDLGNLLKNTVGIINCHYEFCESGVMQEICEALPFNVVGVISSPSAVNGVADSMLLNVMMLTSDDVEFECILTSPFGDDPCKSVIDSYKQSASAREDAPSLIFAFAPFEPIRCVDDYVDAITEASGGVPCFGTVAVDDLVSFLNCNMIYNGEHYYDRLGMILAYGNISPKFYVANFSESNILDRSAVITKSEKQIVKEINGRSVDAFFEDLGLKQASETTFALTSLPFLINYKDNSPLVCKQFVNLNEERHAVFAGAMPEGSTFYLAQAERDDIFATIDKITDDILKDAEGASGLLIYSCVARIMILGSGMYEELEAVGKKLDGRLPYIMGYSGGEMCPTNNESGDAVNYFHNNTIIACLF